MDKLDVYFRRDYSVRLCSKKKKSSVFSLVVVVLFPCNNVDS
jgi:hypothetical protein